MGLGLDPQVVAAVNAALTEFVNEASDFYNTRENIQVLRDFLKSQNVPLEQQVSAMVWHAAHGKCKAAGTLEQAPPPKTEAQRIAELELNDRLPGYHGGVRPAEETPYEKMQRMEKDRQERAESARHKAQADAEAARVAAAASTDVSMVPSVAAILSGESRSIGQLTSAEQRALSSAQLKRWMLNSRGAEAEIANQRSLEREKKLRENK